MGRAACRVVLGDSPVQCCSRACGGGGEAEGWFCTAWRREGWGGCDSSLQLSSGCWWRRHLLRGEKWKDKGQCTQKSAREILVRKKERIGHTESSPTLAQVPRDVVAYPEVIQDLSGQSPKLPSAALACSEQGMYPMASKSRFQWNQSHYFLVVKACKQLWQEESLRKVKLDSTKISFREERGGTCHAKVVVEVALTLARSLQSQSCLPCLVTHRQGRAFALQQRPFGSFFWCGTKKGGSKPER